MKAALRRMAGDGESEKLWKRLLGSSRTLPETVGEGVFATPGGGAISGGSSIEVCP